MILAGGMSTRLYPLTKQVPKPLVPVAGEPITAHVMRWLASFGYTDLAMNVHYLAEKIETDLNNGSQYGVKLTYVHEEKLMGSAGALKPLQSFFTETFVVVGCDDLTNADLKALVAFHKERGALATIGLLEVEEVDQYGVVITDDNGRILEFQEKPAKGTERSKFANTGIYVFEPGVLDFIPADTFYDFGKQVFPALLEAGAGFFGMKFGNTYWRDIGTPSEYRLATDDVLAGRVTLPGTRTTGVPAETKLGTDVQISGDVRVGDNVTIGNGARITGPTVIGNNVAVGDGAVLDHSIVWDGSTIGTRAHLTNTVVGINYDVAKGTSLVDKIVANEPVPT
jgi:NDP-sugar pyrophosphorylase family protein